MNCLVVIQVFSRHTGFPCSNAANILPRSSHASASSRNVKSRSKTTAAVLTDFSPAITIHLFSPRHHRKALPLSSLYALTIFRSNKGSIEFNGKDSDPYKKARDGSRVHCPRGSSAPGTHFDSRLVAIAAGLSPAENPYQRTRFRWWLAVAETGCFRAALVMCSCRSTATPKTLVASATSTSSPSVRGRSTIKLKQL